MSTQQTHTIYIGISSTQEQSALALVIYDEDGLKVRDYVIDLDKPVNNTELEMIALIEGLEYALDDDEIVMRSDFCVRGFNEWLDNWKRKGWRKADNKPVAYRDYWQIVEKLRSAKYIKVRRAERCCPKIDEAYALAKPTHHH
ncbi:RNase H family protein [Vibrio metschnikovii]|uniref:RNase H family protein n=1 Tax=Vibrio metschnikovii TaxID=28172 RepID=UPI001302A5DF|nr:RNase H family protein [Vibrio metschnikovii]